MKWATWALALCACAHHEPPPPVPVHWTDHKGNPVRDPGRTTESVRWREAQRQAQPSGAPASSESTVPRLRCNDGTLSVTCGVGGEQAGCCVNQRGLAHDRWGNVIYE